MKQIEIHNFGPIKDAKIDIKPMLVLIGPQASGKSTIAKLIYFWKTVPNNFVIGHISLKGETDSDPEKCLKESILNVFFSLFGLQKNFKIIYTFKDNKTLIISSNDKGVISIEFSNDFYTNWTKLNMLKNRLLEPIKNDLVSQITKEEWSNAYTLELAKLFRDEHKSFLFSIAGRNAILDFSHPFEEYLSQSVFQKKFDNETTTEKLMRIYVEKISVIRKFFAKYGNFKNIIAFAKNNKMEKTLSIAYQLINKILIGEYNISNTGEETIIHSNGSINLNEASSGQQEAIRILQDAFLSIYQDDTLFRVVEEPEAHLFPEAQKATIELLTLALNNKNENNLIITTHSPYTLTVINNLIFAAKVGNSSPEKVNEVVPKELWLPTERVAAYLLKDGAAENIIDDELGEIKAEMIDEVSQIINQEYDNIYNIQYETKGENN